VSDLTVSLALVAALVLVFAYVFIRTRRADPETLPAAAVTSGERTP
jgi:flagellar biogenesis protein FliO